MDQILFIREIIVKFCKKHQALILNVLKFVFALILFNYIGKIGFVGESFVKYTTAPLSFPILMLICIIFTVSSLPTGYVCIIAYVALQLSGVLEIALIVTVFLLLIMFFYVRIAPEKSVLILAALAGFYLNIPFITPIIAGLYMGLSSIIPITIGVFLWRSFIPTIKGILPTFKTAGSDFTEIPVIFSDLYVSIINSVKGDNEWIFVAFIFAMVVILVYAISRLSIDFAKEMAIGLGAALNVVSFIIIVIITGLNENMFYIFLSTLFSAVAAYAVRFFDCLLDYSRAENVQFEDEDNYYYVKIIPKIAMTKKKRVVKRIRPEKND